MLVFIYETTHMLINVTGLTRGYKPEAPLFSDLNFTLDKGEFCFIM